MMVEVRRIYDPPAEADGTRILVDRLWPRGIARDKAMIAHWLKALSPSNELRKLYHGAISDADTAWDAFVAAYTHELETGGADIEAALAIVRDAAASGRVTLLYAARNEARNNAVALRDWLRSRSG